MNKIENSLLFDSPLLGIQKSTISLEHWEETKKAYSNNQYKETVINLLKYLNPQIVKEYGNNDQTELNIPHGSTMINIFIKDKMFKVVAPFLKMPGKNQNVIMRQIVELNFFSLILSQILLKDNEFYFTYSTPLELCEPYKLYDILYEICIYADYYDDIFIQDLGAERSCPMQVKAYSDLQKETLYKRFVKYLDESIDHLNYFETNRWYIPGLDSARISLMKIDYILMPQGKLVSDIQNTLKKSFNRNIPPNELFDKTKKAIGIMRALSKDAFLESMYIPCFLIPPKKRATLSIVQNTIKPDYESAKNFCGQNNYFASTHYSLYAIYNLLYRNTIPPEIEELLVKGLIQTSGIGWKEAAEKLLSLLADIMQRK